MFGINGLLYIPQYISEPHHKMLIQTIDEQPWRTDLSRRTQHYGYIYDYRAKRVDPAMYLGELPSWLQRIAVQLYRDGLTLAVPDQAIINEYEPGQGIADHIDCVPCFGNVVVSLSLAAPVVMDLKRDSQSIPILLEPRSLLVLRDEARYQWSHGIARRKQDIVDDTAVKRERRLSVTFRKIIGDKSQ
jgi:alkylated DNA repair dioxygenase AlkB